MPEELTKLEKDIRAEYKGVLACFDGLVEGLPRLAADLSHGGYHMVATVLSGVESSHAHWRLSDHYLDLRERLNTTIRYGEMLAELINTADELWKPVEKNPMVEVLEKTIDTRTATERLQDDIINKGE